MKNLKFWYLCLTVACLLGICPDMKGQTHQVDKDNSMITSALSSQGDSLKYTADPAKEKEDAIKELLHGKKLPSFSLTDFNGNLINSDSLIGKVVFINFWFVFCPPCLQEIPKYNKLVEEYRDKGVVFLAISIGDTQEDLQKFLEFAKEKKDKLKFDSFNFTLIPTNQKEALQNNNLQLAKQNFGTTAAPTNFIFNQKGELELVMIGRSTYANREHLFTETLDRLLK